MESKELKKDPSASSCPKLHKHQNGQDGAKKPQEFVAFYAQNNTSS
jgi:hypothetical protein